jgi:hypothetical protein
MTGTCNFKKRHTIKAGGRPTHPLDRLEATFDESGDSSDALPFWQGPASVDPDDPKSWWFLFSAQLDRWQEFQGLQRMARGQSTYDYWRNKWEETQKINSWMAAQHRFIPETEDDWQRKWQQNKIYNENRTVVVLGHYRTFNNFVRYQDRSAEPQGFHEYVEAAKERLAAHEFTRSVELDNDLARQDSLMTWIEYLAYEYWWNDLYTGDVKRFASRHERAWQKVVGAGVLEEGETEDVIRTNSCALQDRDNHDKSKRAVAKAVSAVSAAEEAISTPNTSQASAGKLQQKLLEARSTLEAAKEREELLQRRSDLLIDFVHRTRAYSDAKRKAEEQRPLLRWILRQIPLIEMELSMPDVPRKNLMSKEGEKQGKESDETSEVAGSSVHGEQGSINKASKEQLPRRLGASTNLNHPNSVLPPAPVSSPSKLSTARLSTTEESDDTNGRAAKRSKGSRGDTLPVFKPRRSSRIAEREQRLGALASSILRTSTARPDTTEESDGAIARAVKRSRSGCEHPAPAGQPRRSSRIAERRQRLAPCPTLQPKPSKRKRASEPKKTVKKRSRGRA